MTVRLRAIAFVRPRFLPREIAFASIRANVLIAALKRADAAIARSETSSPLSKFSPSRSEIANPLSAAHPQT
ncbi:MAG: hypothetical protein SWY16_13260 [Cyanobacteriota bacterium]|nr:hypothetical protein [Cyanobacteriota bacterium]